MRCKIFLRSFVDNELYYLFLVTYTFMIIVNYSSLIMMNNSFPMKYDKLFTLEVNYFTRYIKVR